MDRLREPAYAAAAAAVITIVFIWARAQFYGDELANSDLFKPAALNAIMVYLIVNAGVSAGASCQKSLEPF